ncbi:hypothetical protein GOP47_0003180 [Adiantum capillus-veneris]|uniref:Secreted protein n=1 Tax=Adiantum capillus-veneris TaxID=13818 RepID=A0A9D4ZS07_ADICA|nr:hypothetical protein GOP47_0003180 [Adiantum capillus-veneris]
MSWQRSQSWLAFYFFLNLHSLETASQASSSEYCAKSRSLSVVSASSTFDSYLGAGGSLCSSIFSTSIAFVNSLEGTIGNGSRVASKFVTNSAAFFATSCYAYSKGSVSSSFEG